MSLTSVSPPIPRTLDEPVLQAQHLRLGYRVGRDFVPAVDDVSFSLFAGERLMILGPSGCGKSTLLRAVAGFISPEAGELLLDGRDDLAPGPDRAVVFQEFDQLFPWRRVRGNVSYPLRVNGLEKAAARRRADRFLELTGLTSAADRYPHQLSGGMKQRVAIARALALEPRVLLMDEPFGALDAQTRDRLQTELKEIAIGTGVTVLFVTHSISEAVYLGSRVVVLGEGPSTVAEVVTVDGLDDPADPRFTGCVRYLRALLADARSTPSRPSADAEVPT